MFWSWTACLIHLQDVDLSLLTGAHSLFWVCNSQGDDNFYQSISHFWHLAHSSRKFGDIGMIVTKTVVRHCCYFRKKSQIVSQLKKMQKNPLSTGNSTVFNTPGNSRTFKIIQWNLVVVSINLHSFTTWILRKPLHTTSWNVTIRPRQTVVLHDVTPGLIIIIWISS